MKKTIKVEKVLGLSFFLTYITVSLCEPIKGAIIHILFLVGIILLIPYIKRGVNGIVWLAILMMLLPIITNVSDYTLIIKYELYWSIFILMTRMKNIPASIIKASTFTSMIHVFATWLFFLVPALYAVYLYSYALGIYGELPGGVDNVSKGYVAALTSHYSANALYIVMAFMGLACILQENIEKKKKYYVLFFLSAIALLLSTKRAHFLFGVISLFGVLFYENRKKIPALVFKTISIGLICGVVALFVYAVYPEVFLIIERLQRTTDSGRFELWSKALNFWNQAPFFGIGWLQFHERYLQYSFVTYNTHNVYLQLLCETGLFGLTLFLAFMFKSMQTALYLLRRIRRYSSADRLLIRFASTTVLFFSLYSLTGNCLYDNTLFYFLMADGCLFSVYSRLKLQYT